MTREKYNGAVKRNGGPGAVFFPGDNYGCLAPLLYYPRKAALTAGCDVLSLEYGYQVARERATMDQAKYVVEESLSAINLALTPVHRHLLLMSKTLGTFIAGQVAEQFAGLGVSHIYLTPITASLPYLVRSKGLVFTGTSDPQFGADERRQLVGVNALEVEDALSWPRKQTSTD